MLNLVLDLPLWLAVLIAILVSAGFAGLVPMFLRRHVGHETLRLNNEVAGFKYAILGSVYGVLLAFVTLTVYEEFKEGRAVVQRESSTLSTMYRLADGFEPPLRSEIRRGLAAYVRSVLEDEWPLLAQGKEHAGTREIVVRIWQTYTRFTPVTEKDKLIYAQSLAALDDFYAARRDRVLASQTELPGFMWFVLVCGAVLTLSFAFFFGAPSLKAQVTMASMLAAMLALTLLLIAQLDNPFRGPISVEKTPLEHVFQIMKEYH